MCHGFLAEEDDLGLGSSVKSVIGRARRVCQMAERIISGHKDPLYRNGLLVFVKQLQKGDENISKLVMYIVKTFHHYNNRIMQKICFFKNIFLILDNICVKVVVM